MNYDREEQNQEECTDVDGLSVNVDGEMVILHIGREVIQQDRCVCFYLTVDEASMFAHGMAATAFQASMNVRRMMQGIHMATPEDIIRGNQP